MLDFGAVPGRKLWGAVSGGGGSTATCLSHTWCPWSSGMWDRLVLGCSRGSAFLVVPLAAPFPPPALRPARISQLAPTVNPWISHLLGFRSLFPLQTEQ